MTQVARRRPSGRRRAIFFTSCNIGSTRGAGVGYALPVMATSNASAPTIQQRLAHAKQQLEEMDNVRKEANVFKMAFQPAPAMPQGGAPPMDPSMMQGQPPMDPAMMQGQPPMDPSMMQGQPPMDPAMMQGQPPMDPSMMGPPPGGVPPEQLEEMMSLLEQMGQGLQQAMQRIDGLEQQIQQMGPQVEELSQTLQSAMQPSQEQDPAAAGGGW